MVEVTAVIPPPGLHARPAAVLAQVAGRYASQITLVKGGRTASARSMMSMMSLGLTAGSTVTVRAEGHDEVMAATGFAEGLAAAIAGTIIQ